ncbi:MAG: NAD(P)/FAD-dependent oxidoreductase [Candidatus Omnitrophica bacterium]|nr:NAD(P)/FAD-dependent oxidoreductase [Candidatus Omnitrophota bacterium]
MEIYDIAVVGGGPAGMMAAITASTLKQKVILIERNRSLGKKMHLCGGGRCNFTNSSGLDTFIEAFGKQGLFLRTAFKQFSNRDLIKFFKAHGVFFKEEANGRIFPKKGNAHLIVRTLEKCLVQGQVKLSYDSRLKNLAKLKDCFRLDIAASRIFAKKVILATGGISYKETGSTGDGFIIAERVGHRITFLKPGLVPLKVVEPWVRQLSGVAVSNVVVTFSPEIPDGKKLKSEPGEIIFTHFGVSGPLILDLSSRVVSFLRPGKNISLFIDFKPELNQEELKKLLVRKFSGSKNKQLKNVLTGFIPQKLTLPFLNQAKIAVNHKVSQLSRRDFHQLVIYLKAFPLTVSATLPIDQAMVTDGGILTKEINPQTMESKVLAGLYLAGEIIEGSGISGGYNLQQAFSTGYLAAKGACSD